VAALAPFGSHRRSIKPEDSVGHLIGGFGVKPDDSSWAKDIITDDSRSRPVWTALPEDKSNDKGRWKTETSFQTVAVFKDPPTWRTDNLTWEVSFVTIWVLMLRLTADLVFPQSGDSIPGCR
jgi:hypothetical protein